MLDTSNWLLPDRSYHTLQPLPTAVPSSVFRLVVCGPSPKIVRPWNNGLVAVFPDMMRSRFWVNERTCSFVSVTPILAKCAVEPLLPTYSRHVGRRIEEMGEVVEWPTSMGHRNAMAAGIQPVFKCVEAAALDGQDPGRHRAIKPGEVSGRWESRVSVAV